MIAGIIFGVLAFVAIIVAALFFIKKRRAQLGGFIKLDDSKEKKTREKRGQKELLSIKSKSKNKKEGSGDNEGEEGKDTEVNLTGGSGGNEDYYGEEFHEDADDIDDHQNTNN